MRNIRTWKDIKDARYKGELTHAEEQLIASCQDGRRCTLEDGHLPRTPTDRCRIGADLLRYVILGGCSGKSFHEYGLVLTGAYIAGELNLTMAQAKGATGLINCYFGEELQAFQASFKVLNLMGSVLSKGMNGQGCVIEGNLTLSTSAPSSEDEVTLSSFLSEGQVRLSSAIIHGNLDCTNGSFVNPAGHALNLQGAVVDGNVFLSGGFFSHGEVRLYGAKIKGQMDCSQGRFCNKDKNALLLRSAEIKEFKWQDVAEFEGTLDLRSATLGTLIDDTESWDKVASLYLMGCSYDELDGLHEFETRQDWLAKGSYVNGEFSPQPYTQLAKVLRTTGHDRAARRVLFEKECRLSDDAEERGAARLKSMRAHAAPQQQYPAQVHQADLNRLRLSLFKDWLWNQTLRRVVGYGYMPFMSAIWATVIIFAVAAIAALTYHLGGMVPNSDIILVSQDWTTTAKAPYPAAEWLKTDAGRHYETFSAIAYAADVFVPLVSLGQENAWAPTTQTVWGTLFWMLIWVVKPLGWFITALVAAAISGIIRRE